MHIKAQQMSLIAPTTKHGLSSMCAPCAKGNQKSALTMKQFSLVSLIIINTFPLDFYFLEIFSPLQLYNP